MLPASECEHTYFLGPKPRIRGDSYLRLDGEVGCHFVVAHTMFEKGSRKAFLMLGTTRLQWFDRGVKNVIWFS